MGGLRLAGLGLAAFVALIWSARGLVLGAAGQLLVHEDPLQPADVIVASTADPVADMLEAARLYGEGVAGRIVLCSLAPRPAGEEIRRLGIPFPQPTELAMGILTHSGVPSDAIVVLPDRVDGTSTEMIAVARFLVTQEVATALLIIPRSHTARAAWLLRRALPHGTHLAVRAPRTDPFAADLWWRARAQTREVMAEYLRWANSFLLGDAWSGLHALPN